jgi:hypothetical protein
MGKHKAEPIDANLARVCFPRPGTSADVERHVCTAPDKSGTHDNIRKTSRLETRSEASERSRVDEALVLEEEIAISWLGVWSVKPKAPPNSLLFSRHGTSFSRRDCCVYCIHTGSIAIILGVFNVLGTVMTLTGLSASGSKKSIPPKDSSAFQLGRQKTSLGKNTSRRECHSLNENFRFPEIL